MFCSAEPTASCSQRKLGGDLELLVSAQSWPSPMSTIRWPISARHLIARGALGCLRVTARNRPACLPKEAREYALPRCCRRSARYSDQRGTEHLHLPK